MAESGFDFIVSDYVMPELNGIDLAEKIMPLKNIPFILYTGQGGEEIAQRAFQLGIHDYIRKEIEPTHYEGLLNSIRQSVKKNRAEQIYRVVFESKPEAILVCVCVCDIKGEDNNIRSVMGNLQNMVFMGTPSQVYFLRDVTSVRRIESSLLHATHRFDKMFDLSLHLV